MRDKRQFVLDVQTAARQRVARFKVVKAAIKDYEREYAGALRAK